MEFEFMIKFDKKQTHGFNKYSYCDFVFDIFETVNQINSENIFISIRGFE